MELVFFSKLALPDYFTSSMENSAYNVLIVVKTLITCYSVRVFTT